MLSLLRQQPGQYFQLSTKSVTGTWRDHFFKREDLGTIRSFVKKNADKNIYMTPHGFSRPRRIKQFAVDPHLLYADLDECDPRTCPIKPTIAIESSPGRYVGYWKTDKPASEELNRRLCYMIGADKSGWDRTQVLRVPGTKNYKYKPAPGVKVLWSDGPQYKVDDLERRIPVLMNGHDHGDSDGDADEVFKKYEKSLSPWARLTLRAKKAPVGKRSEVLWKLNNELLESGLSTDEAFTLLHSSIWNKFRDRPRGDDQLRRELDKASAMALRRPAVAKKAEESWNPLPMALSDVEEEEIDWLIPSFLARRELTIIEGDPGLGKSYLMQMVAKAICDGDGLPVFKWAGEESGIVAYFDTENTASTVTKPRMMENGLKRADHFFQGPDAFSIASDEDRLVVRERLAEIKPTLIVFDTINTYLGGTETHNASSTGQVMSFFKAMAVDFNCSVAVLRHLTKSSGGEKALYRGQGSIAFTGAARIVATVGQHPEEEEERVVACTKINIARPFHSFTFTIDPLPDTARRSNRSKFVWGSHVNYSSDELMSSKAREGGGDSAKKAADAEALILEALRDGRMEMMRVRTMAEARGVSERTLDRAARRLNVTRDREGFGRGARFWWSMP